jgi:ferredoxin-NADP reductase
VRYTLVHANRTFEELAYHRELQRIEAAARFPFSYLASVSRPTARDREDASLGEGRANNVLRLLFGMPLKEEEDLARAERERGDVARARAALEAAVRPKLPRRFEAERFRAGLDAATTVILTCGNPSSMSDIKHVAERSGVRYEKEDWKLVLPAR